MRILLDTGIALMLAGGIMLAGAEADGPRWWLWNAAGVLLMVAGGICAERVARRL